MLLVSLWLLGTRAPSVGLPAASCRHRICLASRRLTAMGAWWILALAVWKAPSSFLDVFSSLFRVCVLLKKTRRWRLSEHGIKFSLPIPHFDGASSIVGGRAEVRLRRISRDSVGICLRWISLDPVFLCLCFCVYGLDPCDIRFSTSAVVAVLMHWSFEALARWLPDYLLQQGSPSSDKGGSMMAALLRFVSVIVVVARWSTDLDEFFVTSHVLCTVMLFDE